MEQATPYTHLFSPGNIGSVTLKNRIVMEPMVMGTGETDGTPGEQMLAYYEERAKGGVGLILTEATRVDDSAGTLAPRQLAMSRDKHIAPYARLVKRVHKHGAKIFCELHHPGRQNYSILVGTNNISQAIGSVWKGYWKLFFKVAGFSKQIEKTGLLLPVVAPSAVPCRLQQQKTRALRSKEITKIIHKFGDAALRVKKAGGDGVQLHAAHGYLIQQFLSPHTNRRTDQYGGSLENRMRFLTEVIADIKQKCGAEFPLIVRLSLEENYEKIGEPGQGLQLEEGLQIAKKLEELGVDALDVSCATYETMNYWLEPTTFPPGWRAYLAKAVKQQVSIPVIAANLVRSPEQAEQQLRSGVQDYIGLGRPLLADPAWAEKIRQGKEADVRRCICCLWCFESMLDNAWGGGAGECAMNPRCCAEYKYPQPFKAVGAGKTVAVVGAGPAGLMAAGVLGKRGFLPVVLEQAAEAGGQLRLADQPPHKEKIGWSYADLEHTAKAAGAQLRYNTTATVALLQEMNPYAVFLATGAEEIVPCIPGADGETVYSVSQILTGEAALQGKTVVVVGSGMTGLETAEFLCANGNTVTVVEMADTLAPGTYHQHVEDILPKLNGYGATLLTQQKLIAISESGVTLQHTQTGEKTQLAAEGVVLSLGVKSHAPLKEALQQSFSKVYTIGDAAHIGRIAQATHTAFQAAVSLE